MTGQILIYVLIAFLALVASATVGFVMFICYVQGLTDGYHNSGTEKVAKRIRSLKLTQGPRVKL